MQLTLHATSPTPHGASRLVQAMPACSVKTRRAPSRHCRDARAYGHTSTAMHDNEYTTPAFFFGGGGRSQLIAELYHMCEVNNLYSAQVGMVVSRSFDGRAPKKQLHSTPIAVSGSGYTGI